MPETFFPDAGQRDRYVTIQQRSSADAVDASYAPTETWTTLYSGYFSKNDIGGREKFMAHQMTAPYDTRWRGNYRPDMDRELVPDLPKLRRLVYQNRYYDIVDAQIIGRRQGIELLTMAGGTAQ